MIVMPTTVVIKQDQIEWIHRRFMLEVDSGSGVTLKQDRFLRRSCLPILILISNRSTATWRASGWQN